MIKYNKYNQFRFEEFEGGNGGEGSEVTETVTQTTPSFDPKEFAREFGSTFASQFAQEHAKATPKVEPQMSPEDIKKALKVWEPDEVWETKFDNLTTRRAAIQEMRDKLVEQADTIAQARMYQMQEGFKKQFEPVQSMLAQRQAEEQISRFEKTYPSLANPTLAPMRESIGQKLLASGAFAGKSESQAFDILANSMAEVAKQFNPEFTLGKSAQTQPSVRSGNGITPTSIGSNGGGSGNSEGDNRQGGKLPKAVGLFPKIRG